MTPRVELELSGSVWAELQRRQRETGGDFGRIADDALSEAFQLERHSLFQVSTSNALAEGVFAGAVTLGQLRRHGDFGLGTFEGLDGELILLDGDCFRATAGGVVTDVGDHAEVPFAVVTRFAADITRPVEAMVDIDAVKRRLDGLRPSDNLFTGIRIDASFESLMMRAACPARPGEGLLEATRHQSEFSADATEGTIVGFWAPEYARSVGVPGYHFHFISDDRTIGGHVLDMRIGSGEIQLQTETELHLAIPETAEFLTSDLTGEHRDEIEAAETGRQAPS